MEIVFLNSGQEVTKEGLPIKRSMVINTMDTKFLIDCNSDWLDKIHKEKISDLNFIILTRTDTECLNGINFFNECLEKTSKDKINLYLEKATLDYLNTNSANLSQFDMKLYQPGVNFTIDKILFEPFKLNKEGSDSVGMRFLDIVYSAGELLSEESLKYYENANLIVHDTDTWFGKNNERENTVAKTLQFSKQAKPKELILTGTSCRSTVHTLSEINQYCQEIQHKDTKVMIAEPGLRLTLRDHISQVLCEAREGIILRYPQCSQICSKEKTLIVDSKLYKNKSGKFVYLIEEGLCYGVIRLKVPSKMNLTEFEMLADKHRITEENKAKWWGNKEVLFSYGFDIVKLFDIPRTVCVTNSDKTFIEDFKFIETEFIVDDYLKDYKPANLSEDILYRDLRVINSLYANYNEEEGNLSINELIETSKKIYNELTIRGREFDRTKMQPLERKLFKLSHEEYLNKPSDIELLESISDNPIIRQFISIASNSKEGTLFSGALDVIIHMQEPSKVIKEIITNTLTKELNRQNLNFIWGEPEQPHEVYVPLYELNLKRIFPYGIHRLKNNKVISSRFDPFKLMEPKLTFTNLSKLVTHMFRYGTKFILESNIKGTPAILIKSGTNIKLFSEEKKDISILFKSILTESKDLTQKDVILIGKLIYNNDYGAAINDYINGDYVLEEDLVNFIVSDITYFDEDLLDKQLHERKSALHSLSFTDKIKEITSMMIDSDIRANKLIPFLNSVNPDRGVIIKQWNSEYKKGKLTTSWMNCNLTEDSTTTSTPGIPEVSGKVWKKTPIKKEIKKDKKNKLTELEEKENKIQSDKLDILIKEKELKMKQTEELLMDKKAKLIKKLEEELNEGT